VAVAQDVAAESEKQRKPSPLKKGGTLEGAAAMGKSPGTVAAQGTVPMANETAEAEAVVFSDPRWVDGNWDLNQFVGENGKTNWDAVIDAEVNRRAILEKYPAACSNEEPVNFDTGMIPWWAWVKRFHLPEAERLNGRAAMVGYVGCYLIDKATGAGMVQLHDSFLGKLFLGMTLIGVLAIRQVSDVDKFKALFNEATFYDKQWNSTWEGVERPSETEE